MIRFWMAALRLQEMGPMTFYKKLALFDNNIEQLFSSSEKKLQQAHFKPEEIYDIQHPDWHAVENDLAWCQKNNCHILSLDDPRYPVLLKEITSPPLLLFIQGNVDLLSTPQIAVVGSRNPTHAGAETAERFAKTLAHSGYTITSGLAQGIDAAAHEGALQAHGKTIAVMGTGLNFIYPHRNKNLAEKIKLEGALVSEFLPNTRPIAKNFPRRNRIISGLSTGTFVVEAALRSGSLITAHYALEQGREIFALPGSIHNPLARGCHRLIRDGAKLVETADDILEELSPLAAFTTHDRETPKNLLKCGLLNEKQQHLLSFIGFEATPLDVLSIRSGLTASEVSSMLLSLELNGYVSANTGGYIKSKGD